MSLLYDSSKEQQSVHFQRRYANIFWVECNVCMYDGEIGENFLASFALAKLKEHNHYPETMDALIAKLEANLK